MRRVLGVTHTQQRSGVKRRAVSKPDEVIQIPFLQSLEQILNDDGILQEVM